MKMYKDEINKLNNYLNTQLWMDFEMCNIDRGEIILFGYLDELDENKIKVVFKHPYMISCNLSLVYDGEGEFITIVEGDEARQINSKYGVTVGNTIFRIKGANVQGYMFIIAEEVEVYILDDKYRRLES